MDDASSESVGCSAGKLMDLTGMNLARIGSGYFMDLTRIMDGIPDTIDGSCLEAGAY